MTGVDLSAPPPPKPRRVALPGARFGLAWLVVIVLVGGFVAIQVGRQVYASWSIGQQANAVRSQISQLEAENAALQRQLTYLRSDAYISAQARKLLNLGEPGEHVLIIPPGSEVAPPAAAQPEVPPPPPLLEQWLNLFLGS